MLHRSNKSTFRAFTLIEILVVVAIIALLAAIMFPVFARARESARKSSCLSNLKQISLGWMMYTQDYDEMAVPAYYYAGDFSSEYSENAWDFTLGWSASDMNQPVSEAGGLLDPYIKSGQINNCPSFTGDSVGRPSTGYAYNASYIGSDGTHPSANLAQIEKPAETILFADGGAWSSYSNSIIGQNYLRSYNNDPYSAGTAAFRHNDASNVAYADGHVKSITRKFRPIAGHEQFAYFSSDDSAYCTDKSSCTPPG